MKLSTKAFYLLVVVSSTLAVSCSQTNAQTSEPLSTIAPTPAVTETPTLVSTLTSTTIIDLTNLTTSCVELLDAPPKNVKLRNSLVLSSGNTASEGNLYNLETEEKILLEIEPGNYDLIVSPNMQKTAFINYDSEKLIITDVKGKELETVNGFDRHFSLIKWLDDENLEIYKAIDSFLVFNTVTGAKNEFHIEDFPNVKNDYRYHRVFLNTQMTKLIYFVEGNTISDSGYDGSPVALWDMQSSSEIRNIYFSISFSWSPKGEKFLIIAPLKFDEFINFSDDLPYEGGDEVFIVNDKGEMERLTYLATKYETGLFFVSSWSPTGRYIALDMYNKNNPDFGLSVLNINTGEITNYCIHGDWGGAFWSPDESQLAFTQWDGSNSSKPKVYILDLEKNLAFKIVDNAIVSGWMINK
jgi:hypothetical protein